MINVDTTAQEPVENIGPIRKVTGYTQVGRGALAVAKEVNAMADNTQYVVEEVQIKNSILRSLYKGLMVIAKTGAGVSVAVAGARSLGWIDIPDDMDAQVVEVIKSIAYAGAGIVASGIALAGGIVTVMDLMKKRTKEVVTTVPGAASK